MLVERSDFKSIFLFYVWCLNWTLIVVRRLNNFRKRISPATTWNDNQKRKRGSSFKKNKNKNKNNHHEAASYKKPMVNDAENYIRPFCCFFFFFEYFESCLLKIDASCYFYHLNVIVNVCIMFSVFFIFFFFVFVVNFFVSHWSLISVAFFIWLLKL